jgi:hypothetical protein
MNQPLTIKRTLHFSRQTRGRRRLDPGPKPAAESLPPGRVPRVSRLMAVAIRFEEQVRTGRLASYSQLAALGHVTRARVSQNMKPQKRPERSCASARSALWFDDARNVAADNFTKGMNHERERGRGVRHQSRGGGSQARRRAEVLEGVHGDEGWCGGGLPVGQRVCGYVGSAGAAGRLHSVDGHHDGGKETVTIRFRPQGIQALADEWVAAAQETTA